MAFIDQIAKMQAAVYSCYGAPATWTPPGSGPLPLTILPAPLPKDENSGGLFQERPKSTPGRTVRARSTELTALGLMVIDPDTRAPKPVWKGVTINFDGVERAILDDPDPADDLVRSEWVFNLA